MSCKLSDPLLSFKLTDSNNRDSYLVSCTIIMDATTINTRVANEPHRDQCVEPLRSKCSEIGRPNISKFFIRRKNLTAIISYNEYLL